MDSCKEMTEDEEGILWEKGLLGGHSAPSLVYSLYFYNGKLFGLQSGKYRLLRFCNICVKGNLIKVCLKHSTADALFNKA